MPELSIDQLSDLKIAIVENKKQLDALKQEKESVAAENLHFKSENTRLTEEIQSQVFNKENLVKENDKLREEKQKIYDEYDEKQGKISLEITAKKEKLDNQEALVNARLEELT
jgi:regulator of replication initiation timing